MLTQLTEACSVEKEVLSVVSRYYPGLEASVDACLAVFGTMALAARTRPLCLIFETPSGYGKTAVLQMVFPRPGSDVDKYVYRSDKFTPKAFVTHAANISREHLADRDLLPKLRGKVLVTKELAPIFRGRTEELQDNFSTLISVLDGKGFTSDSGMQGQRGYQESIVFNWVGATTPIPRATHRLMSQLGTRLLCYEVPAIQPTEDELVAYAQRDDVGEAEIECQRAVNEFPAEFFHEHPVGSVPQESLAIGEDLSRQLVRWGQLLVGGRAEICYEKNGSEWEPIAANTPEGAWKVIGCFKELARGHALIHGRTHVDETDLELVAEAAVSSIPGHLRRIVRELRCTEEMDSTTVAKLCTVSRTTARRYMTESDLLGITKLKKGDPRTNEPAVVTLAEPFLWLSP